MSYCYVLLLCNIVMSYCYVLLLCPIVICPPNRYTKLQVTLLGNLYIRRCYFSSPIEQFHSTHTRTLISTPY